jgi:hypothetical protein
VLRNLLRNIEACRNDISHTSVTHQSHISHTSVTHQSHIIGHGPQKGWTHSGSLHQKCSSHPTKGEQSTMTGSSRHQRVAATTLRYSEIL